MAVSTIVALCITFLGLALIVISVLYTIINTDKKELRVAVISIYVGAFMLVGGEIAFLIMWYGLVAG